jgi:hypothetical protein
MQAAPGKRRREVALGDDVDVIGDDVDVISEDVDVPAPTCTWFAKTST